MDFWLKNIGPYLEEWTTAPTNIWDDPGPFDYVWMLISDYSCMSYYLCMSHYLCKRLICFQDTCLLHIKIEVHLN
jgi:hypothetical protein